ncbi:MAG: hypothetical protein JXR83_11980, partial [Deltaproteobacteria bacterium]|nr:hypothetical protein [Deltaproteobacteria bacterium]
MTKQDRKIRQLFSERYDERLEGTTARAFDQAVRDDPKLAAEYQRFAEVVDLLHRLPPPKPDPDFARKVAARIHQRRAGQRRSRSQRFTLSVASTITTLAALALVISLAVATHPVSMELDAIAPIAAGAPIEAPVLHASVEAPAGQLATTLGQAFQSGLVRAVAQRPDGAGFTIEVDELQLATFLRWLGNRCP